MSATETTCQRLRESYAHVADTITQEELDANVQQPEETIHEWAYAGDVERVQTYETARESARWLSEHFGTQRLREAPTLPCPLWRRNSEGSRQAIRPATVLMVTPDNPGFRTSRQEAENLMSGYRQRDIEIREAQANNQPTIPFHYTHTLQDATTYYMQGAATTWDGWYHTHPNQTTVSFPIPTPPAQYGIFHERIAFSTTATESYPDQTWNVTVPVYYMQSGNWTGPHTVTFPGEVVWSAATTATATDIFSPPQTGYNVNVVYDRNAGWNIEQQQRLGDSPECNFVRIVERHEIELAYINSKRLLKTWLKPEEYYSLLKFGYMIVPSKLYPNTDYRIHDDDHVYVDAFIDGNGHAAQTYCIHSTESKLQRYDKILAKILLLKADEAEFLRRAITHGGDRLEIIH